MTLNEFMISTVVSGGLLIALCIFFWVRVEIYDCLVSWTPKTGQ